MRAGRTGGLWEGTLVLYPRLAQFAHGFPHWFAKSLLGAFISPMAKLTPGELLGVFKENNAQLLTQISAIFSANGSPGPKGTHSSGNGVTGDQDMDDAWDEEDGEDQTWEDVLPTRGRETRRDGGGSALADRLANPAPLSALNEIVRNHVPYTAVSQEAAPRRNRGDR